MTHPSGIQAHEEAVSGEEIRIMAGILRHCYLDNAADVARHFAHEHKVVGDSRRAETWRRVALCVENTGTIPTLS